MSTKRDDDAVNYALKLLAVARTSAQISGVVNPADWTIACLMESVDNAFTSVKEGNTTADIEKSLIAAVRKRFKDCRAVAAEDDEIGDKAKWIVNDIFNRALGKKR